MQNCLHLYFFVIIGRFIVWCIYFGDIAVFCCLLPLVVNCCIVRHSQSSLCLCSHFFAVFLLAGCLRVAVGLGILRYSRVEDEICEKNIVKSFVI